MCGVSRWWAVGVWAVLAACGLGVDNSGGEAPPGTSTPFAAVDAAGWDCDPFLTSINSDTLVQDDLQADAFVTAQCEGRTTARDWLRARVASLDVAKGQVLMITTLGFGGCQAEPRLKDVMLDGDTVRPWFLQANVAYGRANVSCTEELRVAVRIWTVDGARAATRAERTVGVYNPDLPNAPE
jgi:hypothetical protein